ncbi:MarR family winged helix-turn-helix transcriptional regulator [Geodermatophilus sp. SYSU D00705]
MPHTIDVDRYVPAYITVIASTITTSGSQVYLRNFGVGMNDWRVVSCIGMDPGITAQEISNVTKIDKSVISRSVKSLVAAKLVTVETSPGFRRLYLTGDGARLYKDVVPVALEREELLLAGLSDEEVEQLLGLLRRINANLPALAAYDPRLAPGEGAAAGLERGLDDGPPTLASTSS